MFKEFLRRNKFDSYITLLTFTILFLGFIIFFSASLGVMARYEAKFYAIVQNQFMFGILLGSLAFFSAAFFPQKIIKNFSPFIFLVAIILCALTLVPSIGISHGGARRWIEIFGFSFQPSEILKYSSILFLSAFYSHFHSQFNNWKFRILPALLVSSTVFLVLKEPDLGTSTIILAGIFGIFFLINAKLKDILIIMLCAVPVFVGFYNFYPHAKERVNTFLYPEKNTSDQNYQANQTKISLGSGGIWGDGFGKSTQKYHYLPETVGDSIFAVIGEEFGFVGSLFILLLIISLASRLLFLSYGVRDPWEKGVLSGTGIIILTQTFLNTGSASGAIPFTGVPLPLISHGSTSIIITMAMLGLCAQIHTRTVEH